MQGNNKPPFSSNIFQGKCFCENILRAIHVGFPRCFRKVGYCYTVLLIIRGTKLFFLMFYLPKRWFHIGYVCCGLHTSRPLSYRSARAFFELSNYIVTVDGRRLGATRRRLPSHFSPLRYLETASVRAVLFQQLMREI